MRLGKLKRRLAARAISRLTAAGVALVLIAPCPAAAQPVPLGSGSGININDDRQFARALAAALKTGEFPLALRLLDSRPDLAHDPAAIRLRAQLLASTGRADEALAMLEDLLSAAPLDALARFQLAEIHFNARRDRPAELAYRLALSGSLDPERQRIVQARLASLHDRRDWDFTAGVALAPDSNLNGGSEATTIHIFGLPFALDDKARRRGGVSMSVDAGAQRRWRLSEHSRLIGGLNGALTNSFGAAFNTSELTAQALLENDPSPTLTVSAGPSADWVWLNGELYQTVVGVQLSAERRSQEATTWFVTGRLAEIDDAFSQTRDGQSYALQLGRTHYLTPSSLRRTLAFVERRETGAAFESYWYGRLAQGWLLPLPWSSTVYAEPYLAYRRFDGPDFLFGIQRRDSEIGASLKFSKRNWVFRGAFPYIAVIASHNASNIPLDTFSRQRVEFGMSRQF